MGCGVLNEYVVHDPRGQVLYNVAEQPNYWGALCHGKLRPFDIRIADVGMNEVIHLVRPFPWLLQEMKVFSNGGLIGSVTQDCNLVRPSFSVHDEIGDVVVGIKGPYGMGPCCDIQFTVISTDGNNCKIGKISKKPTHFVSGGLGYIDMLVVSFPWDLDVKIKAILLGACLLMDIMYLERMA